MNDAGGKHQLIDAQRAAMAIAVGQAASELQETMRPMRQHLTMAELTLFLDAGTALELLYRALRG